MREEPRIVLIGGTAGCGKTTLANEIVARWDLDHHLGTGFIRAALQSQADQSREPMLFRSSYETDDPIGNLRAQAIRLLPAVRSCIERARAEGTSLVIEGTHILPELYHDEHSPFIVLEPPADLAEHHHRLTGHRHARRIIGADDMLRIRQIANFYRNEASHFDIPTFRYTDNFEQIIESIVQLSSRQCRRVDQNRRRGPS